MVEENKNEFSYKYEDEEINVALKNYNRGDRNSFSKFLTKHETLEIFKFDEDLISFIIDAATIAKEKNDGEIEDLLLSCLLKCNLKGDAGEAYTKALSLLVNSSQDCLKLTKKALENNMISVMYNVAEYIYEKQDFSITRKIIGLFKEEEKKGAQADLNSLNELINSFYRNVEKCVLNNLQIGVGLFSIKINENQKGVKSRDWKNKMTRRDYLYFKDSQEKFNRKM